MAQISNYGGTKSKDKNKNKTTYTQTNTSDLSGTNRSQAYGNGAPKQRETGKTFTSSVSTNVKPKEVKRNAEKYQSTLNSVSDSSNKKVQSLFSKPKVDTQPKKQTQKSEYDVDTSKFRYKKDYTREDRDRLDSELSTMIEENPYANEDAMYKDMWSDEKKKGFAEQNQKIAEKAQEYSTAKTEVALTKMGEDAQKKGPIKDEDVFENVNGQVKAKDFSNDIKHASDNSARIEDEIKGLEEELAQYSPSIENAQIIGDLNNRIRILRQELNESNSTLDNLQNKQKYQQSRIGKATLDYAKENNDVDTLKELGRQFDSYDDTFIEKRLTNIAKIGVDMTTAVMNIGDIALDLGGDALALASEKYAENMYKNGDIDDEQYNAYLTKAKRYASFDANDPTTASYAMRQLSNQMAYQIANGEDGILKFVGQGLDSTANFLVQFMALGEMGSLAMMGTQSGTQKYFENLEKGYDKTTALLNGIATGVTSYLTEKIGMDNFTSLLTGTAGSKVYAQILDGIARNNGMEIEALARLWMSQGMSEGLEEFVEGNVDYVLDSITAKIANGEPIEYNAGDIFYSMAVGGFSGLLMGGLATGGMVQFVCNTREQYNQLKADVDTAKRIYAETTLKNKQANAEIDSLMNSGEYYNQDTLARISNLEQEISANEQNMASLQGAILAGQDALNAFSNQSQLMGVEFANEQAEPRPDSMGETETLAEALRPNIDELVQNDQKRQALEENIVRSATDFLAMKGVNMQADQFVQLDEAQRNYLLENAEKIQASCPNANIGYATEFYYPDENGNVIDHLRNANAIVIKNEGGRPTIVVNPKGETSAVVSAVHEIIHTIEGTPEYNALFEFVFEGGISGEHFKEKYAELTGDRYAYTKKKGFEGYREVMRECLTCTVTEDMMDDAGAQAFIDHMAKYNTSTAYKLMYKLSEMTGLFKDNSALGRINAMLTEALSNQDVVYLENGISYSTMPYRTQMREFYNDPVNALTNGSNKQLPVSRIGKYKWMPSNLADAPILFARKGLEGIVTGKKSGDHSQHNAVSQEVFENLDYLIDNPLVVFPSKTDKGCYVAVLNAKDNDGYPLFAIVRPVEIAKKQNLYYDVDMVSHNEWNTTIESVYGKDAFEMKALPNGRKAFTPEGSNALTAFVKSSGNPIYPAGKDTTWAEKQIRSLMLSPKTSTDTAVNEYFNKAKQFDIIQNANEKSDGAVSPFEDVAEIKTLEETTNNPDLLLTTNDWDENKIAKAIEDGHTTVYSLSPLADGVEVTPSYSEAVKMAHGGIIYANDVKIDNVAWADSLSGKYAKLTNESTYNGKKPAINSKLLDSQISKQKTEKPLMDKIGSGLHDLNGIDLSNISSDSLLNEALVLKESRDIEDLANASRRLQELMRRYRYADNTGPKYYALNMDAFKVHPEIKDILNVVEEIASKIPPTYDGFSSWDDYKSVPENAERLENMQLDWQEKYIKPEAIVPVGTKPNAIIMMGLSGAGKSTALGKNIVVELDSDGVKTVHPLYGQYKGIVSNAIHDESSGLIKDIEIDLVGDDNTTVEDLWAQGRDVYNVAIPKIFGHDSDAKLQREIDKWRKKGYNVSVKLVDITNEESQIRDASRFANADGRYIPLWVIEGYGDNPYKNFISVMNKEGNADVKFERYNAEGKLVSNVRGDQTQGAYSEDNRQGDWGRGIQETALSSEGETDGGIRNGTSGRTSETVSERKSVGARKYSDDFIRVQKESERLSRETSWGDPSRYSDGDVQRRLSRVFSKELQSRNYSDSNADGLLKNTGDFKIFKDVDGQTFHDIFNTVRPYLKYGELVDVHPVETNDDWTGYNDTKNYLSSDGLSGFAITKDGDLISVFNFNDKKKGFLQAIAPFVMANAKTLDCYVLNNKVNLQMLYQDKFGFKTREVVDYNYDYDHDDIGKRYKEPKVAFMYNPKTTIEYSRKSLQADENSSGVKLSPEQNKYFDNSVARDNFGRLLVLYHGTRSVPFTVFDDNEVNYGFYFTDNPTVSASYLQTKSKEEALNTMIYAPNSQDTEPPSMKRRYAVYLDLKMPLVVNAKGKNWHNLGTAFLNYKAREFGYFRTVEDFNNFLEKYNDVIHDNWWDGVIGDSALEVREVNGKYLLGKFDSKGKWRKFSDNVEVECGNPEEFLRFVGSRANYNFYGKFYSNIPNSVEGLTITDYFTEYAKKNGYDGVIFNNIIDSDTDWGNIQSTVCVAFKPEQIKSINNLTPTKNPDIRYSKMSSNTNESMEEGLAKNAEAVEKYGAFDYGMNPARETDIARRTDNGPTFQTVRTIANSMHIDDDFARRMQAKTGLGGFVKEVQHDKDVIKRSADYIMEHGFAKSYEHVIKANDLHNANRDLTTGILLMDEMESMGLRGTPEYEKLVDKCVQMGNALGVGLRTVSLFKRMSPQGQVITIESEIQRIQEGLNERYKDRAPQLQVPREMLDEYLNPKTKEERRTELRGEIAKNIADQIPPTIWEKLNAFRHLSMLFNPRTWVKNRLANEVFGYINEMTRMVRTVGESVYSQFDKDFEREAGIYNPLSTQDRAWYKKFNDDYFKNVKSNDGKYVSAIDAGDILLDTEFGREISENRKQFSTKFMNWFAETNKKMLSDDPSKSKAYAKSMVGWFKAHNLTPETATPQQMEKAREFALKEALYATFNTDNMLAKAIIQYERYGDKHFGKVAGKVNRMVVESFIPFKRTPLNLMKTGISYTPIGLVKSVVYDGLIKVRNGDMTANQFINNMAQGLTGTGLFLLGALLKSLGVFRTKDDDKDRKKYFDKDNGEQDYSLDFGDFTYTIDWLDPLIVPLAMGAEFTKLIEDGDFTADEVYALGTAMAQPIFDTSMMSGITNNLKSYASDPAEYTTGLGANAITNYASQYIPSVFGALARTVDDTRRTTAVNKGKLDKFAQSALSKIPFASKTLEPYVNKQGEEQKNPTLGLEKYGKAGGLVGRALLNFLSPGYYADREIDKFDEEMYRLYNETGEIGVLPSSTTKSLTYQKDKKDFTKKEYTQWHKTRYKIESEYVNSFIGSSDYKSMSDEERVKTIENIRKYAQEVAKKEFLAGRGISYDPKALKNAQGAMNSGMELYDYYNYKANTEKQEDKIKWMEDNHLTDKEKEYLWELEGYKTSYEDVYKKVFGKEDKKTSKKKSSSTSSKKASSKSSKKSTKSGGATSGTIRRNMASEVSGTIKPHVTQQKKLNSNFYSAYANTFTRKPTQGGSKNTIVCPNCGNRVSSGTNVCPNCGAKL